MDVPKDVPVICVVAREPVIFDRVALLPVKDVIVALFNVVELTTVKLLTATALESTLLLKYIVRLKLLRSFVNQARVGTPVMNDQCKLQ